MIASTTRENDASYPRKVASAVCDAVCSSPSPFWLRHCAKGTCPARATRANALGSPPLMACQAKRGSQRLARRGTFLRWCHRSCQHRPARAPGSWACVVARTTWWDDESRRKGVSLVFRIILNIFILKIFNFKLQVALLSLIVINF